MARSSARFSYEVQEDIDISIHMIVILATLVEIGIVQHCLAG